MSLAKSALDFADRTANSEGFFIFAKALLFTEDRALNQLQFNSMKFRTDNKRER